MKVPPRQAIHLLSLAEKTGQTPNQRAFVKLPGAEQEFLFLWRLLAPDWPEPEVDTIAFAAGAGFDCWLNSEVAKAS